MKCIRVRSGVSICKREVTCSWPKSQTMTGLCVLYFFLFFYDAAGVECHGILCQCTEQGLHEVCDFDTANDAEVVDGGVCISDVEKTGIRGDNMCIRR